MNEGLYRVLTACIPVLFAIITGFIVPYIKSKTSISQLEEIAKWIGKAVQAAEVLFDFPQAGEEKKEYVINFIDKMFNSKKEVISREQISILLEAAWKEMNDSTSSK